MARHSTIFFQALFYKLLFLSNGAAAFSATTTAATAPTTTTKSKMPMFEYLKFDGNPQFDVLAKTQEYCRLLYEEDQSENMEDWYAPDYALRGPVIGPITREDVKGSQKGLGIKEAFPDIRIDTFGYTLDPENPYRCFYFSRWRATMTGDLDNYGSIYPATGAEMETPVSVFSLVFNPDGKIIYEQVGAVVDRLEGNTQGKAAVFGLLHTAGLKISASPGDKIFALIQRFGHLVGGLGKSWSEEKNIPKWWVSSSRGADATEQW